MDQGMLKVLSWGCGIQSTALAVMSALGDYDLPKLDAAIFADTGWERQVTYDIRDWYGEWLEERGIKTYTIFGGDIREDGARKKIEIPFWTENGGPLKRQCTVKFKVYPIMRQLRVLLGYPPSNTANPPAKSVQLWQGISLDEYQRMKDSQRKYIVHYFPLVDKKITRQDCVDYLLSKNLPIPERSACIGCPYRLASEYIRMRDDAPIEFEEAIEFDEENRNNPLAKRGKGNRESRIYIYKKGGESPTPLRNADLEDHASREINSGSELCDGGYCHV